MAVITFWHNPRCSKSRQALALLQERGATIEVRRYLEHSPDHSEITEVLRLLGIGPSDLVRFGEAEAKSAGLSKNSAPGELIDAMAAHPKLIERPIAISGQKAVIGRPPEAVLGLL